MSREQKRNWISRSWGYNELPCWFWGLNVGLQEQQGLSKLSSPPSPLPVRFVLILSVYCMCEVGCFISVYIFVPHVSLESSEARQGLELRMVMSGRVHAGN